MKFFIVVVACSLCFQIAVSDEPGEKSAAGDVEVEEDHEHPAEMAASSTMLRGDYDYLFGKRHLGAQNERKTPVITYNEAQRQLDAEENRTRRDRESTAKQDDHDVGDENDAEDASLGYETPAPSGKPTVTPYQNKPPRPPRRRPRLIGRSRRHRASLVSDSTRKRQQLLFGLNYIKGMLADPQIVATLHSSTREKFGKELHRLQAEIKSVAWDELNDNKHHNK